MKRVKDTALFKKARAFYRRRQALAQLERAAKKLDASAELRILVINHFFDGEIKALDAARPRFPEVEFLPVPPEPHFSEIVHLFPQSVRRADLEYDAASLAPLRARAREISRRVFSDIRGAFAFDCVVTPSDSFYWLREFAAVCRENDIPFVVADKEGTISPASFKSDPVKIRRFYPAVADHFLVWSRRQRDFWRAAGVEEERITITGSARSDIFVNMKRGTPKNVIFFDFDLDAYINMIDWSKTPWSGDRSWACLRAAFRRAAKRLAEEFPKIDFIMKCHPQQAHLSFENSGLDKLPNLRIVRGAEISELLPQSYAVAGFQTTALMEAALAKVPVFYAAWGSLYEAVLPEILPFHEPGHGMILCQDEEAIMHGVREAVRSGGRMTLPDSSKLEVYFESHDGACARRLIAALVLIASRRKRVTHSFQAP